MARLFASLLSLCCWWDCFAISGFMGLDAQRLLVAELVRYFCFIVLEHVPALVDDGKEQG